MFHFTTQTHGHTMVLVGGYKECILLQDVFRKNNDTYKYFFFETEKYLI